MCSLALLSPQLPRSPGYARPPYPQKVRRVAEKVEKSFRVGQTEVLGEFRQVENGEENPSP